MLGFTLFGTVIKLTSFFDFTWSKFKNLVTALTGKLLSVSFLPDSIAGFRATHTPGLAFNLRSQNNKLDAANPADNITGFFAHVVSSSRISNRNYNSVVYNFEVEEDHTYIANNVVVHNCLSCISLHGTRLEPGERVDDHYRGRCSELYKIPGVELPTTMQADSVPGKRRFVPFKTGEEWFASLPPERQAQQASFKASPAKYRAYQDGVKLGEFVGDHEDSVFGNQKIEKSLVGVFGEDAKKYYQINQTKPIDVGERITQKSKKPIVIKQETNIIKSSDDILSEIKSYQYKYETEDMIFARQDYATSGYKDINSRLRKNEPLGEDYNFITQQLDNGFEKNPGIPNNITVYRGANFDASQLTPGIIFEDKGYVSTTLSKEQVGIFARKGNETRIVMEISLPTGTKIYSPSLEGDQFAYEKEVLLPKNSKFKVIERVHGELYTFIKLEYIK
jgi:hypothetical protein